MSIAFDVYAFCLLYNYFKLILCKGVDIRVQRFQQLDSPAPLMVAKFNS
jgi:hypothetical protein